ncbi:MAG: helix-turn-helix transcriptional regulator [Clostridia bacterium]|nr:helix-turn-helix transcriptional regulator [Clostridia bacterium]
MQQAQLRRRYVFHYDMISFHTLQGKIFRLIEEIHSERFGRNAQISLCVNDLILHLNRTVYEMNHPRGSKTEEDLYEGLIQYIEQHLEENLSLESLAQHFFVSKYHIAHLFKERLGLSIHQYIIKKRLAACRDAICSDAGITQIYELYGFQDYSSFFRAFKKEYGMSPKEYRTHYLSQRLDAR